ncbi:MAG: undecaprenyldiphospho-muramoylpentapeptide beta-N-acetylglucosaminyltransferase [Deltaproteobacteria bacterium]|nr:undecaprenyldiphospho-muramoylpentapeptide beta-N-acetylglucosaminyltransferase [Deltaproteobacteria bacterium]
MMAKARRATGEKRLLIAGGGTGGHVYPGIALCQAFLDRFPGGRVLFVGTERGLEAKILPHYGFEIRFIQVQPLKGRSRLRQMVSLANLPRSGLQALKIISEFRPTCVLGVGGYASGPLVAAAAAKGIRTAILEPNAVPGLTNRLLARLVHSVFAGLGYDGGHFPAGKTWAIGTPVRKSIKEATARFSQESLLYVPYALQSKEKFRLLITGGSQGAHSLNRAVVNALTFINIPHENLEILHQTGYADCDWVTRQYRSFPAIAVRVFSYIEEMSEAYRTAHLVIARAGASTLTELATMRRPAVLIPYPGAADQHQLANAKLFERAGAAKMILESELTGHYLANIISQFYQHPEELVSMSNAVGRFHNPMAAEQILDILLPEKK